MNEILTMDEKIDRMMVDLASLKTDVSWLKKLFISLFIPVFMVGGVAIATGVI